MVYINIMYGRRLYGTNIYASSIGGKDPLWDLKYLPGHCTIIAYNKDGTKTAVFGAGAEKNSVSKVTFELLGTGCGKFDITFKKLPTNAELDYKQRIDIHLFNDRLPWYSGYVIVKPAQGTTEKEFKFTGHGFYNILDKILLFGTYEDMDVGQIVQDIARYVERTIPQIEYAQYKIVNVGYKISKIEFDGVSVKDALKQLSDFAIDYVYGIDQMRNLYFKPRLAKINENARFWVGKHLREYSPSVDVEKIINWAKVKGGKIDNAGEQWLATVEDTDSINAYGLQQEVLSLPSAYSTEDAERWGKNQIEKYKDPIKSAKVKGVDLRYPLADGSFFVRKLSTDGLAAIYQLDGTAEKYPITKISYAVDAAKGIAAEMELGEQPFKVDLYFANIERDAKNAELLQSAATRQLKTGG